MDPSLFPTGAYLRRLDDIPLSHALRSVNDTRQQGAYRPED